MSGRTEDRFEAWLDAGNRIVSFHEIPAGQSVSYTHLDVYKRQPLECDQLALA